MPGYAIKMAGGKFTVSSELAMNETQPLKLTHMAAERGVADVYDPDYVLCHSVEDFVPIIYQEHGANAGL